MFTPRAYLGNLKQSLGHVNNASHLLNILDALLDSLGVVGTGAVEDVQHLLLLGLSPSRIGGATVFDECTPDGQQAECRNSLLVHNIVLIADGVDAQSGTAAEKGGLADEAVSGEGVDDALGLGLGFLGRDAAGVAGSDGSGQRRDGSASESRSEEGGACVIVDVVSQIDIASTPPVEEFNANRGLQLLQ